MAKIEFAGGKSLNISGDICGFVGTQESGQKSSMSQQDPQFNGCVIPLGNPRSPCALRIFRK
jgi:hypothetical protein